MSPNKEPNILLICLICILSTLSECSYSQCQSSAANFYYVTSNANSGQGTLRQAILDANAANTGGQIFVSIFGYLNLTTPLPVVTCDSLLVSFSNDIVSGGNMVPDPPLNFAAPHSCYAGDVLFINFVGTTYTVTNTNDSGSGSLREAINSANVSGSSDNIHFDIPGTAPHKIDPLTVLPTFYGPVTIDGSTQPANGYAGSAPKIELDGSFCGSTCFDFKIMSPFVSRSESHYSAAVYGMYVHNFGRAIWTGTNSVDMGLRQFTCGAPGKGNVISGNGAGAWFMEDSLLIVQNNYFGTDTSGSVAFPNVYGFITYGYNANAVNNHIIRNNVISGNTTGLYNWDGNNFSITNNLFGTDKSGTYAIPNTKNAINSSGSNVTIGGTGVGVGNLISGNTAPSGEGVVACYSHPHTIQSNMIGVNLARTDTIPNYGTAILISQAPGSLIGWQFGAPCNLIAATNGIAILLEYSRKSTVQGNYIGTNITGSQVFPNTIGVAVGWPSGNDSISIVGNVISGSNYGISMGGGPNFGHFISLNILRNNGIGIFNGQNKVLMSRNSVYNNNNAGIDNCCGNNDNIQPPQIISCTPISVAGTSRAKAVIELFYSQSLNHTPQGKNYIGKVTADTSGNWIYNGFINDILNVTATQTDTNRNTSEFSKLLYQVAPEVWPGDCNYDLNVDNTDFLYMNIANGDTGAARINATNNWVAQDATDWNKKYSTGVDHKHADTNGDGIVDINDTTAIVQNYGLTHSYRMASPSNQNTVSSLSIIANADSVAPGSTITYNIYLGDSSGVPVDSLYGIAASILFDTLLIDTSQISFNYSPSALGVLHTDMETFEKNFYSLGQIDAAVCRTNRINQVNLFGVIASFNMKVKSSISTTSVLHVMPVNVKALRLDETEVSLNLIGDSVVISPTIVGTGNISKTKSLSIFPNPAKDLINIAYHLDVNQSTEFIIYNSFGQEVLSKPLFNKISSDNLDLSGLQGGVYFWNLKSEQRSMNSGKLIIIK